MDQFKPSFKLVGAPCGQHGQYTFYKAIRLTGDRERIIAIGDFFFVKIWQDSELVSIGELQLLWTDRVSDQTLVSLRLYFLPENTPDGRNLHGQDEVLAINEKVVLRADDLLSWICAGEGWRWGLRAVWRGDCAPRVEQRPTQALHHTKLDLSDVQAEKNAMDPTGPGVVVFSYPRYCRYRALLARLDGLQADWLRDALVAALGGYSAPTPNTRILYCRDTFDYPELESHEFVCNHLWVRLKGRPRGRRRRRRSHGTSSASDTDNDARVSNPRRLSLRNGAASEDDDDKRTEPDSQDEEFVKQLKTFYRQTNEPFRITQGVKHLSLRRLYNSVISRGGYETVCRNKLWREIHPDQARTRRHYEKLLLHYEARERKNFTKIFHKNGKTESDIRTIDITDSPIRDIDKIVLPEKRLRTPSPQKPKTDTEKVEFVSKPAEELNREFLESLPQEDKPLISVKSVEKLIEKSEEKSDLLNCDVLRLLDENKVLVAELVVRFGLRDVGQVVGEVAGRRIGEGTALLLAELAQKLNLGNPDSKTLCSLLNAEPTSALTSLSSMSDKYTFNGHTNNAGSGTEQKTNRPAGRSSLRAVRVKPARTTGIALTATAPPRSESSSSSPPASVTPVTVTATPSITNFGIYHPPPVTNNNQSDDEIVEVPYKPKTPEIIDLDEYPESPQGVKKKKLEILKQRGLEVTAIPPAFTATQTINPIPSILTPNPILLNPTVQHQIMTQAQLFQVYNIMPPYANGVQPPKVIQATSIFGSCGPEKTVYGNPKDPFMPPPHVLTGAPVKPPRNITPNATPPHDILDLSKNATAPSQKPAVEIVRVPTVASPSKASTPQNLSKNYTLVDGKAVVGSNLEITLVSPKVQTPPKSRPPQKRSSNGKFMSAKTPTPPKDYKPHSSPSPSGKRPPNPINPISIPNYQIRDIPSPTSSSGSNNSQTNPSNLMQNFKVQNLAQMMELQKGTMPPMMLDPMYMNAFYSSLAGQIDQRQIALYRDLMANQFRNYSGLLNLGVSNTPTTKN